MPPNTQNWKSLGTIQPSKDSWISFPVTATSGNDLVRVKFAYPDTAYIKGSWAWVRCRYELTSGTHVTQSRRVYPNKETTLLDDFVIPPDLKEKSIKNRRFEAKKGQRPPRLGIQPAPYNWSMVLEELLD